MNKMTKKQKLKLLKDLQSNKISIEDLAPPKLSIKVYSAEKAKYYINGEEVSEEIFKEIQEREILLGNLDEITAGFFDDEEEE